VVTLTDAGREILAQADELGRALLDVIEPAAREVLVETLSRSHTTAR
jgi:DNA-binding MarR family transcriptional regulator